MKNKSDNKHTGGFEPRGRRRARHGKGGMSGRGEMRSRIFRMQLNEDKLIFEVLASKDFGGVFRGKSQDLECEGGLVRKDTYIR